MSAEQPARAQPKSWRTCDLKVVAFLLYAGYAVRSVLRDGCRAVFVFDDSAQRSEAVLSFWNKQQRVEPVAYVECWNRARDMVAQAVRT